MSKYAFAAAAALSALIASSAAMAAKDQTISSTSKFTVSVEIKKGCQIDSTGGDVTFDVTGKTGLSSSAPSFVTTRALVTCTAGTEFDVYLTSDNAFRMARTVGTGPTAVTTYIGYTVNSGDVIMSASSNNRVTVPNLDGIQAAIPMTFTIKSGEWVGTKPVGVYNDYLTLNVNF